MRVALIPFFVSRALVWAATEFGSLYFSRPGPTISAGSFTIGSALAPFFHWDFDYYASIAQYGYAAASANVHAPSLRVAFFPFYPLLIKLAGGSDWAMLLIPNVCLFVAMGLLFVLARRHLEADAANAAVWTLALGPAAMFFSYPYTESVFLLLCIAAFVFLESGSYWLAGVVGMAAALTRVPGFLFAIAPATQFVFGRRRISLVAATLLPAAGLVAVAALDWSQMGDPLGFVHAQQAWVGPPRNLVHIVGSFPNSLIHADPFRPEATGFPVFVVFAIAAVWVAMRLPLPYGAFAIAMLALDFRQGLALHFFTSMSRYVSVVFPSYFAFGALIGSRRNVQIAWLAMSASVMVVHAAMYGAWRFVG